MKKLFLSGISILAIISTILGYLLYSLLNHPKLVALSGYYPIYDKDKAKYVLSPVRPSSWVKLDKISYVARWAIIVSEDWAFYEHKGIDFRQLKIAIEESIEEGELTRGASTITQQVIKNLVLSPKREISRKLKEVILAYQLEKNLSKDQILEIYLNFVELGGGIYGIKNASFYYFNKHPKDLTAKEGAFLAMLLPSPKKYSQSFYDKELTSFAKEQIQSILIKLRQAKVINETERKEALTQRFFWEALDSYQEQAPVEITNEEKSIMDSYLEANQ